MNATIRSMIYFSNEHTRRGCNWYLPIQVADANRFARNRLEAGTELPSLIPACTCQAPETAWI